MSKLLSVKYKCKITETEFVSYNLGQNKNWHCNGHGNLAKWRPCQTADEENVISLLSGNFVNAGKLQFNITITRIKRYALSAVEAEFKLQ